VDSAERYAGLGVSVLRGAARFTGKRTLEVNGATVNARRIVIATGSSPRIPEFLTGIPYLTNETVFNLPARPDHLLIIGGGPMAFEMADAFRALGAEVTMAAGGAPLPREDAELAAPLIAALRARGVNIVEERAVGAGAEPSILLTSGARIAGSHILVAAGRVVDAGGLNLDAAGIAAGRDGIRTNTSLRAIGAKNIFVAGDAADPVGIGPQRFTHVASAHAGVIIKQAIFRLPAKISGTLPVRAIFTAPELAQIGPGVAQAGEGARAITWHFAENDRAIAEGDTTGLVKLVLDKKSRLIGAGICGPGASEMIGFYALAMAEKTSLAALAGLVLPYPTRLEAGKRAISAVLAERIFAPLPRRIAKFLARLP
jgi:pyruvate/2-oxoglutarate dehydrogenase complex dihydrolipoamide dehydrogenase (E3) component